MGLQAIFLGERAADVRLIRAAIVRAGEALRAQGLALPAGAASSAADACELVSTVPQLLQTLGRRTWDLLLLDLAGIPDGPVVLRELREVARRYPVLVLASAEDPYGLQALRDGVQDVLLWEEVTEQSLSRAICFALVRHRSGEKVRRREEQLRLIADSLPVLIAYVDTDCRYRFNNAAYERWLGIRRDALLGKRMSEVLGPEHFERIRTYVEAALRGETTRYEIEVTRPDGSLHWWDAIYLPHVQHNGHVNGFYALVTDTTLRKRSEEVLARATHAAEAANRAKSEFLANMSHEIRSPMTAILGYADVLSRNLRDPDNLECVEVIRRNGRYLIDLIGEVLDLSKIEAGRLQIEYRPFAPDELVVEVRSLMEVRAREKNLPLLVEFPDQIPQTLESDPIRLRQILVNLVSNAIKFTDEGTVRLVTRFCPDAHDSKLQIDVIDTGIGIPLDEQERIFAPFTQADMSVTRRHGGTGLGLAISRRLARMLGGSIHVASQPGRGSTFTLAISAGPAAELTLVSPRTQIATTLGELRPRVKLQGRILVVDDRRDVRFVAQHILEEAGALVVTAENGAEALSAVRHAERQREAIDVVLMDMQMPVMDGYEATQRLREAGFRRPIIALTTHAMRGDREKCLRAGCDDYASKPIDAQRLLELLERYTPARSGPRDSSASPGELKPNAFRAAPSDKGKLAARPGVPVTGRQILLVDDNEDIRQLLKSWLQLRGHQVRTAADGRSALAAAQHEPPEFMVLDIGLPDLSGYEVVRRLRQDPNLRATVFVALSGNADVEDRRRAQQVGFACHLLKPIHPQELDALLDRYPLND